MVLEKEFTFYIKHRTEFQKKYSGKYLVILGEEIFSINNSLQEAYITSLKKGLQLGTFLIREVTADFSDIEQTFHSRVRT